METNQAAERTGSSGIHRPQKAKLCPQQQMCMDIMTSGEDMQRMKIRPQIISQ